MLAPFPHRYSVRLEHRQLVAPPRSPIALGPPPQFGGDDRAWSPEELLVGATLECLWTTFDAYARHAGVVVDDWVGGGVGVLDKGPHGPTFTSIELSVAIVVAAANVEHARQLLARAEDHCIISRALRVPITVHADVHAP